MTADKRIIDTLHLVNAPLCDDCLAPRAQLSYRNYSNQRCNILAQKGHITREHGRCSVCGEYKLVNSLLPQDSSTRSLHTPTTPISSSTLSPSSGGGDGPDHPWDWEGNIQARLATWLAGQGYTIMRVADTASHETGKDVIAEKDGKKLWVTVKGYPKGTTKTNPATQARHWFAGAIFDMLCWKHENPNVALAVAFPNDKKTYHSLTDRMQWLRENLPLTIYWVTELGDVVIE